MNVTRLDHLVLSAADSSEVAAAWREVFGLRAQPALRPDGSDLELTPLPLAGHDRGGAFLELVQALTADHRVAASIDENGEGMFSLSLEVDDLDAAVRELREAGVTVSGPEPGLLPDTRARPERRRRVARFGPAATNGVELQLIERA